MLTATPPPLSFARLVLSGAAGLGFGSSFAEPRDHHAVHPGQRPQHEAGNLAASFRGGAGVRSGPLG